MDDKRDRSLAPLARLFGRQLGLGQHFGRLARSWFPYALMLLASLLACSTLDQLSTQNDPVLPDAAGVKRENALYLRGSQPRTLDPALTRGGASGPIGAIFSGLVSLDSDLQVQPELAGGWSISDDGTRYTFYLRPEATFHDGRLVTAQDVVDSWERAADPSTGSDTAQTYLGDIIGVEEMINGQADHISGVRVLDQHTLEVQIDAPKAYFLSKLTLPVAFVVDLATVDEPGWEYAANGTGAFSLQEWQDDEYIILRRNDGYYGLTTSLEHVVYLLGAGIPLSMYERGDIDIVGIGGANLERVQDPNNSLHEDLRIGVDMCTSYVGFNNAEPPFDDPLVRQAFSQAIDKERIVEGLFLGDALAANGPLPPGMPGYTGENGGYSYDPEMARDLLKQAGYADASDFPVVTFTSSGYGRVGAYSTALISMWQDALGVIVEPVLLDPYNYLDELYEGNTGHIFFSGWCADYPDPENFLDVLFHSDSRQNLISYDDAEVDALLEEARVEGDVEDRLGLYAEIERTIIEDAPSAFLTHSLAAELVKPYVNNYTWTPIGIAQWQRIDLNR